MIVRGRGPVLAVWRGDAAAPTLLALPRAMTLRGVVVWGGAPWAILHAPGDPRGPLSAVALP
ncbi:MAG: hypothetical protein H6709_07655 [Kofleriaceae bacterium]|nr:hypothetical protein [Kofleriaceae bacterium]